MAAVFNLNHHPTYVHFHIGSGNPPFFTFDMSLANVLVIVAMLVVFALAILLPFPHHEGAGSQHHEGIGSQQ
ncbi:MAG: hypothetical protein ACM3UX_01030 [Candidatus Woesearchaeota archaeon]